MSLVVKLLDLPACFLLTFEPLPRDPGATDIPPLKPFRVLVDPVINDTSLPEPREPSCISSLWDLPEIDLVIITHHGPKSCHKPTLRQLPTFDSALRTTPLVLADKTAANTIRRWNHFDPERIRTIPPWRDPGITSRDAVSRVQIPPFIPGGHPGEITVALIPFSKDDGHAVRRGGGPAAVGITYRPPPSATAVRSPRARNNGSALSVVYSPRGTGYASLRSYVTGHLVAEAALPLTCLLHPFDRVEVPWWCFRFLREAGRAGSDAGCEIASALGARGWAWGVSRGTAVEAKGARSRITKVKRWEKTEVEQMLSEGAKEKGKGCRSDVVQLKVGDEVVMTEDGVMEAGKIHQNGSDKHEGYPQPPCSDPEAETGELG